MFSLFAVLCISTLLLIGLFLLVLASPEPRKQPCNRFLFYLLLVNAFLILGALLSSQHVLSFAAHPFLFFGFLAAFYLLPPVLYLYVNAFAKGATDTRRDLVYHALPAVMAWVILAAQYVLRGERPLVPDGVYTLHLVALNVSFFIYYARAWRTLTALRKEQTSRNARFALRWMVISLSIFGVHWSFSTASSLLGQYPQLVEWTEGLSILSLLLFFCAATYLGARHLSFLTTPGLAAKYAGSNLDDAQLKSLSDRITLLAMRDKPFLDPHLSAEKLAELADISPRQLSQVLNDGVGQSFFEWINGYRIEEAKKMLAHPGQRDKTVLEILYAAGFNSKSAFHRAFKEHTGLTPTAYRKKHCCPNPKKDDAKNNPVKKASHFLHQDDA